MKVSEVFKAGEWSLDMTDNKEPFLKINFEGKVSTLPTSKYLLTLQWNGKLKTYMLEGIVIYCPGINAVFISGKQSA